MNHLNELSSKALALGIRILLAAVFFIICIQIIKLIRKLVRKSMERANVEKGAVQFVDSFLKAALYVVLIFLIISNFGVDAASIVALLGSAGVAIGLAVQGSLSNLAGGMLILLLKPFKVGDYIVESTTGYEGTVERIEIFYTRLVTTDNKIVVLPNGNLANNSLVNVTAADMRRLDIKVGVSYRTDLKQAKQVLLDLLEADELVLKEQEHLAFVDELGDSAVIMGIRCWFAKEDYWKGKWQLTEKIKYALDESGIEIPYPQMEIRVKESSQ